MQADDLIQISLRLDETVNELTKMVNAVATAKQVREYNSELRKDLLARHVAPLLADNSATAAETLARASESYQKERAKLQDMFERAEQHLTRYDVLYAKLDATRSILSLAKEQMKL